MSTAASTRVPSIKCDAYEEACSEARKWIEAVTNQAFSNDDFRASLRNGVLLCKLAEKLSGIAIGNLNPIPRSLAWMDNLTTFLNVCRFIGLEKSQLFRVDDLAGVRNQDLPKKVKLQEESRKIRNVLITIYWLAKLSFSLETYQGPLPDLNAFEILTNKRSPRVDEMVNQCVDKSDDLGLLAASTGSSSTWPRLKRNSEETCKSPSGEHSLEHFKQLRKDLIPILTNKVKEKTMMYDSIQREASKDSRHPVERRRSDTNAPSTYDKSFVEKTHRSRSLGMVDAARYRTNDIVVNQIQSRPYSPARSVANKSPVRVATVEDKGDKYQIRARSLSPARNRQNHSVVYDSKSSSTRSPAQPRSTRGRDKDYVSVNQLIQQFSDKNKSTSDYVSSSTLKEHFDGQSNRRSLPANFHVNSAPITHGDSRGERPRSQGVYSKPNNYHPNQPSMPEFSSESVLERVRNAPQVSRPQLAEQRRRSEPPLRNFTGTDIGKAVEKHNVPQKLTSPTITNEDELQRSQAPPRRLSHEVTTVNQADRRETVAQTLNARASVNVTNTPQDPLNAVAPQQRHPGENTLDYNYASYPHGRRKSDPSGMRYATLPARFRSNNDRSSNVARTQEAVSIAHNVLPDRPKIRYEPEINIASQQKNYVEQAPSTLQRRPAYRGQIGEPNRQIRSISDARESSGRPHAGEERARPTWTAPPNLDRQSLEGKVISKPVKDPVEESIAKKAAPSENFAHVKTYEDSKSSYPRYRHEGPAPGPGSRRSNYVPINELRNVPAKTREVSMEYQPGQMQTTLNKPNLYKPSLSTVKSRNGHYSNNDANNNKTPPHAEQALESMFWSRQRDREFRTKTHAKEDPKRGNATVHVQKTMPPDRGGQRDEPKVVRGENYQQRRSQSPYKAAEKDKEGLAVSRDNNLLELVAAEEKYWKGKMEKKGKSLVEEKTRKPPAKVDEKQRRINAMLREYKERGASPGPRVDYSEMTDTLRAEEEYLAQEAEKLMSERRQKKIVIENTGNTKISSTDMPDPVRHKVSEETDHGNKAAFRASGPSSRSYTGQAGISVQSAQQRLKPPSISGSDDLSLKPEADQAYHNIQNKKISRSKSPVYICSGCRLPVQRDICLYVSELQSYWHEKCFRCSVCHVSLVLGRSTPKIRVMSSRIHCENCVSNNQSGRQSTMV